MKSLGPGTVVGEVSLYLGSKASASVLTETDCVIYFLSKDNFQKLNLKSPEKAAELLGAHTIEGGRIPVVLDEYCAPHLLGMYFQAFHAEAAQKGVSRLKGRLNEEIAVP